MKKHRKLVALLVALTFLFSIAAPVMAAESNRAQISADKLNVLGIIEGYPDGSFGLDQNITRAEFAKVAVATAGLTEAAEQLVNFPSQFSDVKTGEWYTGWINMAASQGFVKGDPDGKFRPNDNITYAEVVTVLVRLLGYNDNLTGPWPTNYLAKAVELGITEDVTINASAPAVRGDVFIMTDNTLDCYMVTWSTDELTWKRREGDKKLIVNSFKGSMYEGLVTDISWDGKGSIYLAVQYTNENDKVVEESIKVVDNAIVTGADDAYGLVGKQVEFIRNQKTSGADKKAIVYLGVKDTDTVSHDKATYVAGKYIELDKKKYDLADDFGVTFFPGTDDFDLDTAATFDNVDKVVVVRNDDGDAQWAFIYDYSNPDIIEEIDGDKVYGKVGGKIFETDSKKVQVIVKDGAIADLDALSEGDLVYVVEDTKNADVLVIAVSEVKEGTLEKAKDDYSKLTIDGTAIDADDDILVSDNGGDDFDGINVFSKDMFDNKVSYMLSPSGLIAVVISDVKATQYQYGIVEEIVTTNNVRGIETRIFTADGKAIYSIDSDYYKDLSKEGKNYFLIGDLIAYELDSAGRIDGGKAAVDGSFTDYKDNRARINEVWYRVDSNTVFFGKDGADKNVVSDWDQFKKIAKSSGTSVQFILDDRTGVIKAIFYAGDITQGDNVGVIVDTGRNSGGYYYEIFFEGERVRYNTSSKDPIAGVGKKDFVKFTLSNGKIYAMSKVDYGFLVNGEEVEAATSTYVKVGGEYFYINEDTMIVDVTGSSAKLVGKVGRGDKVVIYGEDKGNVEVIIIRDSALAEKSPDEVAAEAVAKLIEALPAVDKVSLSDKAAVEAARAAYDNLTPAQKALVDSDLVNKLAALEAKINALEEEAAVPYVKELIENLPAVSDVTLADKAAVEAARAAYDNLTPAQKALVDSDLVNKLVALEAKINALEEEAAAAQVDALIEALPKVSEFTFDDEAAVNAANNAYKALDPSQQALVKKMNVTKLNNLLQLMDDSVDAFASASDEDGIKQAIADYGRVLVLDVDAFDALSDDLKDAVAEYMFDNKNEYNDFAERDDIVAAFNDAMSIF